MSAIDWLVFAAMMLTITIVGVFVIAALGKKEDPSPVRPMLVTSRMTTAAARDIAQYSIILCDGRFRVVTQIMEGTGGFTIAVTDTAGNDQSLIYITDPDERLLLVRTPLDLAMECADRLNKKGA